MLLSSGMRRSVAGTVCRLLGVTKISGCPRREQLLKSGVCREKAGSSWCLAILEQRSKVDVGSCT